MNHVVAYQLLSDELNTYRALSFAELVPLVGERSSRINHRDGIDYRLEVAVAKSPAAHDIHVTCSIGEANWGSPHDRLEDAIIIHQPA
ncbi:MAG TPA: hypothetical protein VGM76_09445 [Lacipirellulaceae bacterium]|jgi:hypothetical protein